MSLNFDRGYRWQHAYFQSKLANLMFTFELQRRLAAAGAAAIAVAPRPGNARTSLGRDLPVFARAVLSPRLRLLTFWLCSPPGSPRCPSSGPRPTPASGAGSTTAPAPAQAPAPGRQ